MCIRDSSDPIPRRRYRFLTARANTVLNQTPYTWQTSRSDRVRIHEKQLFLRLLIAKAAVSLSPFPMAEEVINTLRTQPHKLRVLFLIVPALGAPILSLRGGKPIVVGKLPSIRRRIEKKVCLLSPSTPIVSHSRSLLNVRDYLAIRSTDRKKSPGSSHQFRSTLTASVISANPLSFFFQVIVATQQKPRDVPSSSNPDHGSPV